MGTKYNSVAGFALDVLVSVCLLVELL